MIAKSWQRPIEDHAIALEWSPDGKVLAAAAVTGPITLFDGATGEVVTTLAGHRFGTMELGWSADGRSLASVGQDGFLRLWDASAGQERSAVDGGAPWVEHVVWSRIESVVASAAGRTVRLWSDDGTLLRELPPHPSTVSALAWHPHGNVLASAAYGALLVWHSTNPEPIGRFEWKGSILTMAWSPNARYIATGDQDSTVHFWIIESGRDLQMWGYPTKVRELAWDVTSRFLATGGGAAVTVWDCSGRGPEGTRPIVLEAHEGPLTSLAFQRNGPRLASGGADGRVVLWQPNRGKKPLGSVGLNTGVTNLAWSPDDRHLAIGSEAGEILVCGVE